MANSSAVAPAQLATAAQYNNLRDDVLDPTTGHAHTGAADGGVAAAAFVTPACRIYNNANISVGSGAWASLDFNSEEYDNDGMHDGGGANPERITIVTDGIYHLDACVEFAANATNSRGLGILLDGGNYISHVVVHANTDAGIPTVLTLGCDVALTAGQFVELQVYQGSGGPLNVVYAADYSPYLSAHLVSA